MKNDFRERVDRGLSSLEWDERRRQNTLRAVRNEGGRPFMKRKLMTAAVMVLVLMMLTAGALAVKALIFSPEAQAMNVAREAVMARYGLTRETLALFTGTQEKTPDGWLIRFSAEDVLPGEKTGVYTVAVTGGEAQASWSHDDVEQECWANGDYNAPAWGQPQLAGYLRGDAAHTCWERDSEENMTPVATPAPGGEEQFVSPLWGTMSKLDFAATDLTIGQANDIARDALTAAYELPEAVWADADFFDHGVWAAEAGKRLLTLQVGLQLEETSCLCGVTMDAATGEVYEAVMTTGGNG